MKNSTRFSASPVKRVATVGIMAATLECGKLALAVLPNIEVISLLLALYGYVFGCAGILAAFIFCAIEPLIWGFGPWVISYFLYWPTIPLAFYILAMAKKKKAETPEQKKCVSLPIAPVTLILFFTLWFGILTSLIDVGLLTGNYYRFFYRFGVYYLRGIPFYITHLVSNTVIFALAFQPLSCVFRKIRDFGS